MNEETWNTGRNSDHAIFNTQQAGWLLDRLLTRRPMTFAYLAEDMRLELTGAGWFELMGDKASNEVYLPDVLTEIAGVEDSLRTVDSIRAVLRGDAPAFRLSPVIHMLSDGQTHYLSIEVFSMGKPHTWPGLLLIEDISQVGQAIAGDAATHKRAEETLLQRNRKLTQLNMIMTAFTLHLELNQVLQVVVESVSRLLPQMQDATIQLLDEKTGDLVTWAAARGLYAKPRRVTFSPGEGIVGLAIADRRLINVSDIATHPHFAPTSLRVAYRSLLVAPLLTGERVLGTLSIESKTPHAFEEEDEYLVQMLASYSAVAIENARLYTLAQHEIAERKRAETEQMRLQEELRCANEQLEEKIQERTRQLLEAQARLLDQQRLRQEIDLAVQVQTSLLPRQVPSPDGFEFAATTLPAHYVSGDLYDFITPGPETCYIVLADISGRGVSAALLTLTARTLIRTETVHEHSPAAILGQVNAALYQDLLHAQMRITFMVGRLDIDHGKLTYANAGHSGGLYWQYANQTSRTLPTTGMPIGSLAEASVVEGTLTLRPGDVLVFYSDGVIGAANPSGEAFGINRLTALVAAHVDLSAPGIMKTVIDAVETFREDAARSNDLTLIVLKALPRAIPFSYPSKADCLTKIVDLVRQFATAYGSAFVHQLELATSEVVTTMISHAYRASSGEIHGQLTLLPDRVQVDMYDNGVSLAPEGSQMLSLARQLTNELHYEPGTPQGNHWRLVKVH